MGNAKNSCSCVLANKTCRPKNSLLLPQLEAKDPLLLSVVVDIENNPLLKNVNGNGTLITDVLINHWLSKRTAADTLSRQIEEGQYAVVIDYYFNLSELEGGPVLLSMSLLLKKNTSDEYVTLLFCSSDLRDILLNYTVMVDDKPMDLLRYFEQVHYKADSLSHSAFDQKYPCGFMK
jgi:hypothetical protein